MGKASVGVVHVGETHGGAEFACPYEMGWIRDASHSTLAAILPVVDRKTWKVVESPRVHTPLDNGWWACEPAS